MTTVHTVQVGAFIYTQVHIFCILSPITYSAAQRKMRWRDSRDCRPSILELKETETLLQLMGVIKRSRSYNI